MFLINILYYILKIKCQKPFIKDIIFFLYSIYTYNDLCLIGDIEE